MRRNFTGLVKKAQLFHGIPSVGEILNRVNADMSLTDSVKRNFVYRVNSAGLTVNQPGFVVPGVVGNSVGGVPISKYMSPTPFWDGVYTLGKQLYGGNTQKHNLFGF